jgi:hypothetical protein
VDAFVCDVRPDKGARTVTSATTCTATFIGTKVGVRAAKVVSESTIKSECKCVRLLNTKEEFVELITIISRRNLAESVRVVRAEDPCKKVCTIAGKLTGEPKAQLAVASKCESQDAPTITCERISTITIKKCRI